MDDEAPLPQTLSADEIELDADVDDEFNVAAALAATNLQAPYTGTQDGNSDNDVA